ncbi:P2X purinoceptor 7-like [Pongo pygmaeus]|uniref:P2X purinoceptor 7-like n=1 Tax=Pongo pygmaeus TaxID=9600 RepID=UPI0023E09BE6|nr:P2X purinoceptor 7-like [Pongo pygmaeus]
MFTESVRRSMEHQPGMLVYKDSRCPGSFKMFRQLSEEDEDDCITQIPGGKAMVYSSGVTNDGTIYKALVQPRAGREPVTVPTCCSCSDVFLYETNKATRIQSMNYGTIKFFHVIVFSYVSFALVSGKLYQWKERVISSVHSKVKRIAEVKEEIVEKEMKKLVHSVFNTADYTFPLQANTW